MQILIEQNNVLTHKLGPSGRQTGCQEVTELNELFDDV